MSNKVSNHLFELIKSLNKSEKRYFKLYSSRHTIGEENGYLRLFDFIDRMDSYQEDLIFMHFKGQALLNKFSITKARLYSNILRSLDAFNANSSEDAQFYRSLNCADILFDKGLYKQCEKLLASTEKLAQKSERFTILLDIKEKQKRLIENDSYVDSNQSELAEMLESEEMIIADLKMYNELWNVKSLLFQEINLNGKNRTEEVDERLKFLVSRVEGIDVMNYSKRIQHIYHHIHGAYYFATNNYEACYTHLSANLVLFEDKNNNFKNRPNLYFSLLTNLVYVATKLKFYEKAQTFLRLLNIYTEGSVQQHTLDLEVKYFSSKYSLELFLLSEKGDFVQAEKLVPKILEGYKLYGDQINPLRKAYIDFKISIIYLSLGEFSKALSWTNRVLNEDRIDNNHDIHCFAQLINLILHYELKNHRFLPYALNTTKRYLKTRNRIYAFEEVFLKLISQLSRIDGVFDLEDKLVPIEKELIKLKNHPKERNVFDYFDFLTWVQSKLKRKTYLEMKLING